MTRPTKPIHDHHSSLHRLEASQFPNDAFPVQRMRQQDYDTVSAALDDLAAMNEARQAGRQGRRSLLGLFGSILSRTPRLSSPYSPEWIQNQSSRALKGSSTALSQLADAAKRDPEAVLALARVAQQPAELPWWAAITNRIPVMNWLGIENRSSQQDDARLSLQALDTRLLTLPMEWASQALEVYNVLKNAGNKDIGWLASRAFEGQELLTELRNLVLNDDKTALMSLAVAAKQEIQTHNLEPLLALMDPAIRYPFARKYILGYDAGYDNPFRDWPIRDLVEAISIYRHTSRWSDQHQERLEFFYKFLTNLENSNSITLQEARSIYFQDQGLTALAIELKRNDPAGLITELGFLAIHNAERAAVEELKFLVQVNLQNGKLDIEALSVLSQIANPQFGAHGPIRSLAFSFFEDEFSISNFLKLLGEERLSQDQVKQLQDLERIFGPLYRSLANQAQSGQTADQLRFKALELEASLGMAKPLEDLIHMTDQPNSAFQAIHSIANAWIKLAGYDPQHPNQVRSLRFLKELPAEKVDQIANQAGIREENSVLLMDFSETTLNMKLEERILFDLGMAGNKHAQERYLELIGTKVDLVLLGNLPPDISIYIHFPNISDYPASIHDYASSFFTRIKETFRPVLPAQKFLDHSSGTVSASNEAN